jgi:hypothetical protein
VVQTFSYAAASHAAASPHQKAGSSEKTLVAELERAMQFLITTHIPG